jgi:hypothetical protein
VFQGILGHWVPISDANGRSQPLFGCVRGIPVTGMAGLALRLVLYEPIIPAPVVPSMTSGHALLIKKCWWLFG